MINLTRPKYFIPIHGEFRHLVLHSRLAKKVGMSEENILLAENGQIIEFDENGGRIQDNVWTGRVLIDGKGVGDVGRSVLKERRDLSEDGRVVVNMAVDEETGIDMAGATNTLNGAIPTGQGHQGWNSCNVEVKKYTGSIELLPDHKWAQRIPVKES